jgi:hypothetical protein
MIIFDLSCSNNHPFEGWFRSIEDFNSQTEEGLVSCPHCGSLDIRRMPSAIHLASTPAPALTTGEPSEAPAAGHPPTTLKEAIEQIIRGSEDVGSQFADEARRIHYHEAPLRSIRGQATADDCSALQEEGIDVLRLPTLKPEDLN